MHLTALVLACSAMAGAFPIHKRQGGIIPSITSGTSQLLSGLGDTATDTSSSLERLKRNTQPPGADGQQGTLNEKRQGGIIPSITSGTGHLLSGVGDIVTDAGSSLN